MVAVESLSGLNEIEQNMVYQAIAQHAEIYPCADKKSFRDCFTRDRNTRFFWFNTADQSTHVIASMGGVAAS